MFVVVYEFTVKVGAEEKFREAWLTVTKAIFEELGSYGSRLHRSNKENQFIAYAQWPSRETWQKNSTLKNQLAEKARQDMRECLESMEVAYELDVCDDYLKTP